MEDIIQHLEQIIEEIQWGVERNREIRLTKHEYRLIQLSLIGYLQLREELLNSIDNNNHL